VCSSATALVHVSDLFRGPVDRVLGYRSSSSGFDSYTTTFSDG
jgi:hypothetical protein